MTENEPAVDLGSISMLIPPSKDGDPVAREKLLAEMQAYLKVVANRQMDEALRQKVGASDIVQQSFLQIIKNFEQFRGESRAEFRGWIRQIVINETNRARTNFHTQKRDMTREQTIDNRSSQAAGPTPVDRHETPASAAMTEERKKKFYDVLGKLAPRHAEAIKLRSIQKMSFREIGETMDCTEQAASKIWHRAMANFEKILLANDTFDDNS